MYKWKYSRKKIFQSVANADCIVIDCSNDWKSKQKKIINNNNECIDSCNNSTLYKYEYKRKCFENCNYYYFLDNDKNFHCTFNSSCPKEYPKLADNNKECFQNNISEIIKNLLNNKRNEFEKSSEKTIKVYDDILQIVEDKFTSEYYDSSSLDNKQDEIIYAEKLIITLAAYENQRNNSNNSMTKIDLGECETLLRNFYNISNNESIYIKKIDIIQEKMKTLKVEYDVYAKLFGQNLTKLNLNICEKNKISIFIPIKINGNIDKYNSSSGYYNDICYTTTTKDETDIILKDRQLEFIEQDKIICQEDCEFSEYNYDTFIAKCSCKVKESDKSFIDMKINKEKILDNFKNVKNFLNFNFLICYKKLFIKEGILYNIGCYLLLSIILFHIISIFVFSIKQFSLLINKKKQLYSKKNR